MGKNYLSRSRVAWGLFLWLITAFSSSGSADTALYNDGVWIVNGVDSTNPALSHIDVLVGGESVGRFTELTVFHSFGGGFPQVYSIQGSGELRPAVPTGPLGGAFYLTSYWDCFAGPPVNLGITSLNIQPNTRNFNFLKFSGSLSNGVSLQATNLALNLSLLNNNAVRLDVRYTVYAANNICVDPSRQSTGEGFQIARMASNYISPQVMDNDGLRAKGFLGPICGCCGCFWQVGYICSAFTNRTGYVLPYAASMANTLLLMAHQQVGPQFTPELRIYVNKPGPSSCRVQGNTVFTADPTENNVNLWANWTNAKPQYLLGQKILPFHFRLEAWPPQPESCTLFVP
jgi:hypothetical protein